LECFKATSSQNYDYVVLQATENSIPFYESMGFTRVGCIQGKAPSSTGYASSPVKKYVVQKEWEKPVDIAKEFGVDVLDIEFLNIPVWGPSFKKNVWLKKGTEVFIPLTNEKDVNNVKNAAIKWYTAKEDETPRGIALKHKVKYADFIAANQKRYPELVGNSRLKAGTRIQVSRFDIDDSDYMPYPHWTFPDDELDEETNEPSYMMALKLNRKFGKDADETPVEDSLAVEIQPYSPESNGVKDLLVEPKISQINASTKAKSTAKEPKKPKRPPTPFLLFSTHVRTTKKANFAGKTFVDSNKLISEMWKAMSDEEKSPFYQQFEESKPAYAESLKQYERELEAFRRNNPLSSDPVAGVDTSLLEQVVKLKSTNGIPGYASKFEYFYVLTYIPDLQWVHLIPMRKVGVFDENKHPKSDGRPIWMIVSEDEGKEFDTSAANCKVVSSRTINNSADADEEQWDIYESGDKPPLAPIFAPRKSAQDLKPSTSTKPLSSTETQKTPKGSKQGKQTQTPSTAKTAKKTPTVSSASKSASQKIPQRGAKKKERQLSSAPGTPLVSSKSNAKKRKYSPTKTPRSSSPNRWPKRSRQARAGGQSRESSIAPKVIAGTCTVKVRVLGRIYDSPQSLEDADPILSSSLIEAIKSGTFTLKVRVSGEIIDPEMEDEAKTSSTASLHSSERKLAPIFTKKYTRSSTARPSSSTNSTCRGQKDRDVSPRCSPKPKTSRRSPRVKHNCTPENRDLSAVVSDDGLSESSQEYMPRRKRARIA
jgi:high mobility group protein B1